VLREKLVHLRGRPADERFRVEDPREVGHDRRERLVRNRLAAATIIRDDPRLQAIYLTSFNCGPDSFIIDFFRQIMGHKPFLELEIDDHTADAGLITRCEAFLESLKMGKGGLS